MTDLVIVLTTVADDERAEQLARRLVDERLAACVNLHAPMVSLYRWQGRLERDTERDNFFGAEEATKYGLVDKVLHSRAEAAPAA